MDAGTGEDTAVRPVRTLASRVLDVTGRLFITVGLLMLSFVAYQLWGTGIKQAQSQKKLEQQFTAQTGAGTTQGSPAPGATSPGAGTLHEGDVLGRIRIPAIGVDTWMVAGAKLKDLEKGPGVFPKSAMPGHLGNFAVAGHRTSYGAPFGNIDALEKGDSIILSTLDGSFTYSVTGNEIVDPSNVSVIRTVDPTRAVATLVTCHPKWTSSRRLIVHAELTSQQTPMTSTSVVDIAAPTEAATFDEVTPGWFHDRTRVWPTLLWSLALVLVWLTGWLLVRRHRREVHAARTGMMSVSSLEMWWNRVGLCAAVLSLAVLFGLGLYTLFENLSGLLPANI